MGHNSCDGCIFKQVLAVHGHEKERGEHYLFVSYFVSPHHSLVLFVRCLVRHALNTLHGDVHGRGLHTRHGNVQHPGTISSLVKNQMKNFFITITRTIISIKTRRREATVTGGGGSVVYLICSPFVCALSLSLFLTSLLLCYYNFTGMRRRNRRTCGHMSREICVNEGE